MIRKALITLLRKLVKGQASSMDTVYDYESIKSYGFDSKPPKGAMCLLMPNNNDTSNPLGIEYNNKKRYSDLEESSVVLYNPENNSHVLIKKDGIIEIGLEDFEQIVKATKLKDWIKDEINSVFNSHTHTYSGIAVVGGTTGTSSGTTGTPSSSMTDPLENDIASQKHLVGD